MSLIKKYLHETEKQKQAIEQAKLDLIEYTMFGSINPMMNPPRSMNDNRYSQL